MKKFLILLTVLSLLFIFSACSATGGIGIVTFDPLLLFMNLIQPGIFWMGDTKALSLAGSPIRPIHQVTFTYSYYLKKGEVTNNDYVNFLNDSEVSPTGFLNGHKLLDIGGPYCEIEYTGTEFRTISHLKGNYPLHSVSWWGAIEYCNWLSEKAGLSIAYDVSDGQLLTAEGSPTKDITIVEGYRLPTEAEWEYAARGAENDYLTTTDYLFAGSNTIDDVAWYVDNSFNATFPMVSGKGTQICNEKEPNEIGFFDMSGNVAEWCHDWYLNTYYSSSPPTNPIGHHTGTSRSTRGGSWNMPEAFSIILERTFTNPDNLFAFIGFRFALTKQ
jgi:formylglycine-generating enzyme required for sulfatase activity